MKVLLIAPVNSIIRPGQFLAPPLGLYRIKSFLERKLRELRCDILDTNLYGGKIPSNYLNEKYDIIGSSILEGTQEDTLEIHKYFKEKNEKSIAICGGQGVVAKNIEKILITYPFVDYIITGLGELPLLKFIENFHLRHFNSIDGIAYRDKDKSIEIHPFKPISQQEFDDINLINYSTIPYEKYWHFNLGLYDAHDLKIMKNSKMVKTVRVNTSTHCNSGCSFCSATNFFSNCKGKQRVINQSTKSIVETIGKILRCHLETETIFFNDDNFVNSKQKIVELSKLIQSNGFHKKVNFICLSRLDNVSIDILNLLKEMNVGMIIYGIESFDINVIKSMNKSLNDNYIEVCKSNILSTLKIGITPLLNIILFPPHCNIQSVTKSIDESLFFISKGARLGLNILIELFEGSKIAVQKELYDLIDIDNKRYILPIDSICKKTVRIFFDERNELLCEYESKIEAKTNNNLLLKNLFVYYSIYTILSINTSSIIDLSKKICNYD